MTKDSDNNGETDRKKELEKLYSNLDDIQTSSADVANSVINIAKDIIFDFNEKAKDQTRHWLFELDKESKDRNQRFRDQFKSFFGEDEESSLGRSDDFFPRFYQIRDSFDKGCLFGHSPFRKFDENDITTRFSDMFAGAFRSGKTPFGYYAFKTPSTRVYNDCLTKKGESIWDSQGYWRCLFPNSEVPLELLKYKAEKLPQEILTKEDLQNEINLRGVDGSADTIDLGEKGHFFRKFDEYLNWKNIMYENVKQERLKMKKFLKEKNEQNVGGEKQVISSSLHSDYSTNPETNNVELHEIKTEVYSDGTSVTTKITKSKPFGSDKWETENETVEKGDSSSSKGWFWK
jgi:archaellum component FlaC